VREHEASELVQQVSESGSGPAVRTTGGGRKAGRKLSCREREERNAWRLKTN
jgi:hypothetical protein